MRRYLIFILLPVLGALSSCATSKLRNPSFDLTESEARSAIAVMSRDPVPLERPLLVIGGFFDPGFGAAAMKKKFSRITSDIRIAEVSFSGCQDFDACVDRVLLTVDEQFPNSDPGETREVDVVAISMGGLVARYAALPRSGKRRLNINRLFTISTPHLGADLAVLPTTNELQIQMRPGSAILHSLAATAPDYEIFPYVRLRDSIVGADNTAPEGEIPWWVYPPPLKPSHLFSFDDIRFIAEIGSRLRGSEGFATTPRSPLPLDSD